MGTYRAAARVTAAANLLGITLQTSWQRVTCGLSVYSRHRNEALGLTQPLIEMSARSIKMFLGSRAQPVRRADNLTAICEPIVQTLWDPRHLTTLYASMACYGNSLLSFFFLLYRHYAPEVHITSCTGQEVNGFGVYWWLNWDWTSWLRFSWSS
jgi:hypothetical protein